MFGFALASQSWIGEKPSKKGLKYGSACRLRAMARPMAGSVRRRDAPINGPILMPPMSAIDHSDIDGRLLQLLLAAAELPPGADAHD